MKKLFELDLKNYDINGEKFYRPSARGIIIKDGKIAMIHSKKFNYYKFPGGGIEKDEDKILAMIREVQEETGLTVIPESVKEYGMVHRIQKGDFEDIFEQDNYYYLCQVEEGIQAQKLDEYEYEEGFNVQYVKPQYAIDVNLNEEHFGYDPVMIEREVRILKMLKEVVDNK